MLILFATELENERRVRTMLINLWIWFGFHYSSTLIYFDVTQMEVKKLVAQVRQSLRCFSDCRIERCANGLLVWVLGLVGEPNE